MVVAPDYPGLGSAGIHPFLIGEDTARSVIDGERAACATRGAAAGSRYAVWGESQGGHAALWTAQASRAYAPDLTLVEAAAAAPPTNLAQNLRSTSNRALKSFFTAYIGRSWSVSYGAPLSSLGNRQTQGIITRLADNNCIMLNMKPKLGMILGISVLNSRLQSIDIGRIEQWAGLARRNSPTIANIGVPLLIAQNAKDDLVAPAVPRPMSVGYAGQATGCGRSRFRARGMRPARRTARRRPCHGSPIASPASPHRAIAQDVDGGAADQPTMIVVLMPSIEWPNLPQCTL